MTIAAKYKPYPKTDNTKPSINCIYYPSIYNTNTTIRLKQHNGGTKLTINIAILYLITFPLESNKWLRMANDG